MEPIPEEDHELISFSPTQTVKHEKKSRLTEVYTSEQVDTLVRIPSTYLSEALAGPTSARGSTYSYTYESHYDEPSNETLPDVCFPNKELNGDIERHSSQTKKITRVTKVTTTRSVRHLPVTNQEAEYFFDANGSPLPVTRITPPYEHDEDTSCRHNIAYDAPPPAPSSFHGTEHYTLRDVPSAPGVPEITDVTSYDIGLRWQCPDVQGRAGSVIGYQVEICEIGTSEWYLAHENLIKENRFRIKNLSPHIEYEIRVVAVNSAGRGMPSATSASVQLRLDYDLHSDFIGWRGTAPGRPYVLLLDSDRIVLEWAPAIANSDSAPVAGYEVSYRASGSDWIQSNDYPITTCRTEISNLKPNGEYEFRVRAKTADGLSEPSLSSGFIRLKPSVPSRVPPLTKAESSFSPPGQPQIEEIELNWVRLRWAEGGSPDEPPASYIVEYREIGDPLWYTATTSVCITSYTVECLRPNSTYEFRVIARARDGSISTPSAISDIVQLRPSIKSGVVHGVPAKPQPPEYVDFGSGDRVTLCWFPAASSLPIQGYDVEFRDHQQDAAWYKINETLIRSCKMTVGDLIPDHEYQFRVIACNSVGYSVPSDPSPGVHIGISYNGNDNYVETATYGAVPLLQDEIVRESPPLPDRDDSPPPIHKKFLREKDVHWRDPTLREVIEYLDSVNKIEQLNASGYLQHLTFNDNAIKEETRELGGIPKLVRLLSSDVPDIQKNVCGCLKNLSFGKENDENKRAINGAGGIVALAALLRQTHDAQVMEEVTATLWNLSSCDDLKPAILNQVSEPITQRIVVPGSGSIRNNAESGLRMSHSINMFKNGTGVLRQISKNRIFRNVSAASFNARKILRGCPGLIESLIHYLHHAILRNQIDTRSVENVVCTLRNLSYRIQEVKDENYNPKAVFEASQRERSKSAPSESPKSKKKESNKKKRIAQSTAVNGSRSVMGAELLWQSQLVKLYLKLLQEASNPEILEASAGAIQNLAACHFEPSVNVRACIRTEKGLPVLVELLRLNDDKVVRAVTTALRNLSLDQRNRELIGKYAMKDLVAKLPLVDQRFRDPNVSDATIGAILGILFETVKHSADFTRNIHECGGTERLRNLACSYPIYSTRICKYASQRLQLPGALDTAEMVANVLQVLYLMWQHKELHDDFKRNGLKESDFYSGTTIRARDATTLSRPISSQGTERPTHLKSENFDDNASTYGTGRYNTLDSRASAPEGSAYGKTFSERNPQNLSLQSRNNRMHSFGSLHQAGEPLYASVHKRSERCGPTGGDSWV
ncbi:fibronectin type III domain protein [Onchocerca flexuosa]|uniref:Fibronectin type III domain protein n=1 Tax=Onchocerca flexuosa TaxID=387005 RepID=A0A238BXZ9_9BILA|nr:fibronectin type III domain protein [Onchocerca flexuosa]